MQYTIRHILFIQNMSFPTLHGEASNGKTKVWSIQVREQDGCGIIQTIRGFLGGKMQVNEKIISIGKNVGKKNETTPYQQAVLESQSAWTKMTESGYSPIQQQQQQLTTNKKSIDIAAPLPMLAHDYNKRGKSAKFPCYVQPKLDGVRAVGQNGLFSRARKPFAHLDHIVNELPSDIILDGELYTNKLTFQEIVGLVKKETLSSEDAKKQLQIKYYVYDIISDKPYAERNRDLLDLFHTHAFEHLVLVQTETCQSESHMKEMHAKYVSDGYEGIMLRSPSGLYKNGRSVDLLKYKEFMDDEYIVVGFREGDGLEKGCVIWICQTEEGKTFHCRPRGTHEDRAILFQNGNQYIGRKLTVRFQELTSSEEKVPRFPVGICFRDYE